MREVRWILERSIVIAMTLLGALMASGLAAPVMNANETQLSKGVVESALRSPSNAQAYLQSAIQHFGTSTNAAVGLVSLFAAELGNVAACDEKQASDLAKALEKLLKDPTNAALSALLPTGDLAIAIASAMGGVDPAGGPAFPTGAFGSFGSSAGTGVATSPAT